VSSEAADEVGLEEARRLVEEELSPAVAEERRRLAWRREYVLLLAVLALITAFAFAFFYFDIDVARLDAYGYVGVFLITFIGAASIVLPMPGLAAILGGGALLDPVLGVPAPIVVGLVAGVAESLGEFTGYMAGYGGSVIVQERAFYSVLERWMRRHGFVVMLVMSAIPNPVFDAAGIAAGAVRMPLVQFYVAVLIGKVIKDMYIASGGFAGSQALQHFFG